MKKLVQCKSRKKSNRTQYSISFIEAFIQNKIAIIKINITFSLENNINMKILTFTSKSIKREFGLGTK